jgi:IstB-like ATP binding protein
MLFEVFSQRYERSPTLVTGNLPFAEWTEVLGSERLTGALLDRLTHHVHILEMNGASFRLKNSKKRRDSIPQWPLTLSLFPDEDVVRYGIPGVVDADEEQQQDCRSDAEQGLAQMEASGICRYGQRYVRRAGQQDVE